MSAFVDSCDPEAMFEDIECVFRLNDCQRRILHILESNPGGGRPWWWRNSPSTLRPIFLKARPLPETTVSELLLLHRYEHGWKINPPEGS